MFRGKRDRSVSHNVWQKYENVKQRYSTTENKFAAEKLLTLGEVGVTDRCMEESESARVCKDINNS